MVDEHETKGDPRMKKDEVKSNYTSQVFMTDRYVIPFRQTIVTDS